MCVCVGGGGEINKIFKYKRGKKVFLITFYFFNSRQLFSTVVCNRKNDFRQRKTARRQLRPISIKFERGFREPR